jgi:hypothetical protein
MDEAREVALPLFILLKPEEPAEPDEQDRESAEMEAEYQRNPPAEVMFDREDELGTEMIAKLPRTQSD